VRKPDRAPDLSRFGFAGPAAIHRPVTESEYRGHVRFPSRLRDPSLPLSLSLPPSLSPSLSLPPALSLPVPRNRILATNG
jgi:hypothetical protein